MHAWRAVLFDGPHCVLGPGGRLVDLEGWLADAGLEDVRLERSGAIAFFEGRRPRVGP